MMIDRFILSAGLVVIASCAGLAGLRLAIMFEPAGAVLQQEVRPVSPPPQRVDPRGVIEEVLARPLFDEGRRPRRPAAPVIDERPAPRPISRSPVPQVVGIVVTPEFREVLVSTGQGRPSRKRVGDSAMDWRVEEIAPSGVTVARTGERQVLTVTRNALPSRKKFSF